MCCRPLSRNQKENRKQTVWPHDRNISFSGNFAISYSLIYGDKNIPYNTDLYSYETAL